MKAIKKIEFIPYTKGIHEWKYSKNYYYRQVLRSYFKQNPYVKPKIVYDDITANIKEYTDNIIQTTALPWGYEHFKSVCREINNELQNDHKPKQTLLRDKKFNAGFFQNAARVQPIYYDRRRIYSIKIANKSVFG